MPSLKDELEPNPEGGDNDPQKGVDTDGGDVEQRTKRPEPDEAQDRQPEPAVEPVRTGDGGTEEEVGEHKQQVGQATVPLPVLQEERRKRQALEARLHERDASFQRLDERLAHLNNLVEAGKEEPAPDPEEDPVKWLAHNQTQLTNKIDTINQALYGMQQAQTSQQAGMQLNQLEQQFRNAYPDYDQALEHVSSNISAQLGVFGLTDAEQNAQKQNYFQAIVTNALQAGINPAEAIYNMANQTGFQPQTKDEKGNGAQPPVDDHLQTVQRGQQANKSLQQAGGKVERKLTLEALDDMDDAEFDEATSGDKWRKMWKTVS